METPSPESPLSTPGISASTAVKIFAGLMLLLVAVKFGRSFGHHLPALEEWISGQGWRGGLVFIGLTVICTSVFVPDTLFAVMAGILFGVVWGTAIMTVGVLLAATLNFALSRRLLHEIVRHWLNRQPRLAAIERAVNHEGFRFQLLIRLTPLSPVAVNYMLGVTNTRYSTFLAACAGMIPALIAEVYLGRVAKQMAKVAHEPGVHSWTHTALAVGGLVACLALFTYVTRIARRAISEYETAALRSA